LSAVTYPTVHPLGTLARDFEWNGACRRPV